MLNLVQNEGEILKYWRDNGVLEKVRAKNKEGKLYFFLEGPPYANGELHMGHVRGYSRKDAILRYRRLRGYSVFDRGGFDVHGLPIENKVEKDLGIKSKKEIEAAIGVKNFIKSCTEAYRNYSSLQMSMARSYGVWFDFDNSYIPASPDYISKAFGVFKKIYDKKLVYKEIQVMPYCVHCGTVLAKGPEVEEETDTDPSVYVLFRANSHSPDARMDLGEGDVHLLIWTTTPWTLPGNVLVAANPKHLYVLANIAGRRIILAKDRLDAVLNTLDESATIEKEFYGSELEGLLYINPLETAVPAQKELRKKHRIVFSEELVSMTDGTGLVHIAPAFGPEDFVIGKKEKAPLLSVVNTDGKYNSLAGKYEGIGLIHEANRAIEKELKDLGAMMLKSDITHSYPHCWRCHEKLVYLPTEQWFINIGKIRKKIIKACDKVSWYPEALKRWFIESIETAPDWVISRQRYWGIPMPIWECGSCKGIKVLGSYDEISKASNGAVKFTSEDLHRPVIDDVKLVCEKCGGLMGRISDVFDVWYDSGVAHTASLSDSEFNSMYGKAFVTEGPDQIRGWFATLMKTGIAAYGKSPFNNILMQGWVVDSKGEAMHKSKGNYVSADDLLGKYSVDAVRAFTMSRLTYENLKFSKSEVEEMQGMVMLLYNIGNLLAEYSSAIDYKPARPRRPPKPGKLDPEDAWILSRLNRTIKTATEGFEGYEVSKAVVALKKFIIEDLSRFYLKGAKKNVLYSNRKKAKVTIDIINYLLYNTILAASPIMPFSTEKIYLQNYGSESIFMEKWPKFSEAFINRDLEESFDYAVESITAILNAREKLGIRLRQPLSEAVVAVNKDSTYNSLQRLVYLLEDYTNIRKVDIKMGASTSKEIRPLFEKLGPEFKQNAAAVADALKEGDAEKMLKDISSTGHYSLHTANGTFNINQAHFTIVEKAFDEKALAFKYGVVTVNPEIDEELREEALIREFERRVQLERKEMSLKKVDRIRLRYRLPIDILKVVDKNRKRIMKDLNSEEMSELTSESEGREMDIDGEKIRLEIVRVGPK